MGYQINFQTVYNLTQDLKLHKKKVVFTHGAFDLFHAGHSLFLNKTKSLGDVLVVGLEPDSNIKKYKGNLRPIIPLEQRLEVLTNHRAVDFVFAIEELERCIDEYYLKLYESFKPSVVTFGNNFAVASKRRHQRIKGVQLKEVKGEVSSTTKIITSIVNRYHS